MTDRKSRIESLNQIFNQGNYNSLRALSRPSYPKVLIFDPRSKGTYFDGRLNTELIDRYKNKVLNDTELDNMLSLSGNKTTFLLPDNGRN